MLQPDTVVLGDPGASLSPLPRGHIKADTTQALTRWKSWTGSAQTRLFPLYQATRIC